MSEKKDWRLAVLHIRDEIHNIREFVEDCRQNNKAYDKKTLYALARSFQIIGEAAKRVPDDVRKQFPAIPWKKMAGFRDIIVHNYDAIDTEIVKNLIHEELDSLEKEIMNLQLPEEL